MMIKRKNDKKVVEKLVAQGRPLGYELLSNDREAAYGYKQKQIKLESGDILFIFSDGLIEAINSSGEEFSEKRLKNALQKYSDSEATEIKDNIINDFREFISNKKPDDDVTFLICKYDKDAA